MLKNSVSFRSFDSAILRALLKKATSTESLFILWDEHTVIAGNGISETEVDVLSRTICAGFPSHVVHILRIIMMHNAMDSKKAEIHQILKMKRTQF